MEAKAVPSLLQPFAIALQRCQTRSKGLVSEVKQRRIKAEISELKM